MQDGGRVVDNVDLVGPRPGMVVGEAGLRIAAELPGEGDILRGHLDAVGPFQVRLQLDRHRHALRAVRPVLDLGEAVGDGRQLGADQAGILPTWIVSRDLADNEVERVGLDHLRIDIRMERRGELGDPDGQLVLGGLRLTRQQQRGGQAGRGKRREMFHGSLASLADRGACYLLFASRQTLGWSLFSRPLDSLAKRRCALYAQVPHLSPRGASIMPRIDESRPWSQAALHRGAHRLGHAFARGRQIRRDAREAHHRRGP